MAYPVYIVILWGFIYLKFGKEDIAPVANLSGKLHEPPNDLKPYIVDTLVNKTLTPSGRSVSSTILELVRLGFVGISYKDRVDSFGNRSREYFLELIATKAKNINDLPQMEQRLLAFVFQGSAAHVSFSKVKNYLIKKHSTTREFWKYWKDQIMFDLMRGNIVNKSSYWIEKFVYTGKENGINIEYIVMLSEIYVLFILFYGSQRGIFFFFAIFIFVCFLLLILFKKLIYKRSIIGNDEYSKWMAFKSWLEDYSITKKYPIDSLILWEKYLVYGMALGVSERALSELPLNFDILGSLSESALAFLPVERYSPGKDNFEIENILKNIIDLADNIFGKLSQKRSL